MERRKATPGDVRLWLLELEDALAPHLAKGERGYPRREVRNLIEDLSFRFAQMDGRAAPDDADLGAALDALHSPKRVAEVLARRRDAYRRKRRAAVIRGWSILALLILAAWGVSQMATGSESVPIASVTYGNATEETGLVERETFVVPPGLSRLDVTVHATGLDPGGQALVRLYDPSGAIAYDRGFSREARAYDHRNLAPTPGTWTAEIYFLQTKGAVRADLLGVRDR